MLDERESRFIAQQWSGPRYRKLFNYATNGWRNQLRVSSTSFVSPGGMSIGLRILHGIHPIAA